MKRDQLTLRWLTVLGVGLINVMLAEKQKQKKLGSEAVCKSQIKW